MVGFNIPGWHRVCPRRRSLSFIFDIFNEYYSKRDVESMVKNKVIENQFQFITSTIEGCIYFPGFSKVELKTKNTHKYCNDIYFQNLKETLLKDKNSIIIFGGRFPLYLSNYFFDNQEGGVEGKNGQINIIE